MNKNILTDRRFWPLFFTQFFGALNDNLFKNAIAILITYKALSIGKFSPEQMVTLSSGIFILPFFIFSAISGQLADKFRKPIIIRFVKLFEICIMIIGMLGFVMENLTLLLCGLFMMGIHSTLFGPVKYSILPNLLRDDELVTGNAYVETGTFIAILIGSIVGGLMIVVPGNGPWMAGVTVIAVAVIGFGISLFVQPIPPVNPDLKLKWNPITTTWEIIQIAREVRSVFLSIIGISWFWLVGLALLSVFPTYCKDFLHANASVVTLFLALFSIGIGVGSILCEKLSFKRTELGLVPIGSLGISLFALDLFLVGDPGFAAGHLTNVTQFLSTLPGKRIAVDLFMMAVFSGFFTVPLYTFIQYRSKPEIRSRVIAANNIMNSIFMVGSSGLLMLLYHFDLSYPQIFLVISILNILAAAYIYTVIPEFMLRLLIWGVTNIIYRLKVIGRENLPMDGAFVIACNHVTFVDGLIVAAGCPRPPRFVMYYKYFDIPIVKQLFRDGKIIPIAGQNEDAKVLEAAFEQIAFELNDCEVVCIFPEGSLTKDGTMQEFRPGIEHIIERTPVPVVPACLNGLWGSFFSRKYENDRKPFRRKWSRISLEFGPPIPPEEATAEKLYDVIKGMKAEEV
ncbi:MAG: MFS transporter [Candidatus Saccharibacteria bacterium]